MGRACALLCELNLLGHLNGACWVNEDYLYNIITLVHSQTLQRVSCWTRTPEEHYEWWISSLNVKAESVSWSCPCTDKYLAGKWAWNPCYLWTNCMFLHQALLSSSSHVLRAHGPKCYEIHCIHTLHRTGWRLYPRLGRHRLSLILVQLAMGQRHGPSARSRLRRGVTWLSESTGWRDTGLVYVTS